MKKVITVYLSVDGSVDDFGFDLEGTGVSYLKENHIDRTSLMESAVEACKRFGNDFTVNYKADGGSILFRGRKVLTSKGYFFALREIANGIPTLRGGSLKLPDYYREIISHEFLLSGGLVFIAGAPGNGKSTTLSATLIERLLVFGGLAVSIEDPPEFQMTGKIGDGYCFQLPVCEENGGDFAGAIKASLRMYPARQLSTILMIGEIRDSKTAAQVLRDSINGHLILTTVHANDLQSAISRIISLASNEISIDEARDLMAQSLKVGVHQKISNGLPLLKIIVNDGTNTGITTRIRNNEVFGLKSEIMRQNNLLKTGRFPINE